MSNQPSSPWDTTNNPPEQVRDYFGSISINAWWCMLVTGQGKLPYDEKVLDPKHGKPVRRYTAIDLGLTPLPESNLQFEISRSMLAEFGEWKDVTLPSLHDVGILDASQLNGKYAHIELVPTGRKFTVDGNEREATAVKFLAVYEDEKACLAAFNSGVQVEAAQQPAPSGNGNKEKDTATKFLPHYVQNAVRASNGDLDKAREALDKAIAGQPLLKKYFTVDSEEVMGLLMKEMVPF